MEKLIQYYSALSNEIEKCGGVESLSGFGSDGTSVTIGHQEVASKLKRNYPKIITTVTTIDLPLQYSLSLKKNITFLMKNNYLIC